MAHEKDPENPLTVSLIHAVENLGRPERWPFGRYWYFWWRQHVVENLLRFLGSLAAPGYSRRDPMSRSRIEDVHIVMRVRAACLGDCAVVQNTAGSTFSEINRAVPRSDHLPTPNPNPNPYPIPYPNPYHRDT